jgi:hypothetical protein
LSVTVAFEAVLKVTSSASFVSSSASAQTVTAIVSQVSSGWNVTVPAAVT